MYGVVLYCVLATSARYTALPTAALSVPRASGALRPSSRARGRPAAGEDALMNVSIEARADGSIGGHVRIRSKTQGVALSMGDRITFKQKSK